MEPTPLRLLRRLEARVPLVYFRELSSNTKAGGSIAKSLAAVTDGDIISVSFRNSSKAQAVPTGAAAITLHFPALRSGSMALSWASRRKQTPSSEGHSFFNRDKYFELTLAEMDRFLIELGWLEKKSAMP